jgi:hypothetical protein
MQIEDIAPGARVRAAGHDEHGESVRLIRRPDAPVMVVRRVLVETTWFLDGAQHAAVFEARELEPAVK